MQSDIDILVIEDAHDLRTLLLELLWEEGFHTLGADNGIDGLRLVREFKPLVVVCDVMLPGLDGVSIWREARDGGQNAAFIFTSAGAIPDLSESAAFFIAKPFDLDEILSAIEDAFRSQAQSAANTNRRPGRAIPRTR